MTINKLLRVDEWYDSKIPLLILPFIYRAIFFKTNDVIFKMIALLMFYCLFLGFGYLINDFADIKVDKKAGKIKVIHNMSKFTVIILLCIIVGLGSSLLIIFNHSLKSLTTIVIIYFFGASYSMPPLRFKERGIWGLIVSSGAQRCLPLLAMVNVLEIPIDKYYIAWMLLSFFVGMRYILVHQNIDMDNDIKAGVNTFAAANKRKVTLLINVFFLFEIAMCVYLISAVIIKYNMVVIFCVAYVFLFAVRWKGSKAVFGHGGLYSFDQMPLEDYYNNFLPIICMVILVLQDISWVPILLIWIIVMFHSIVVHLRFPIRYLGDQILRKRSK